VPADAAAKRSVQLIGGDFTAFHCIIDSSSDALVETVVAQDKLQVPSQPFPVAALPPLSFLPRRTLRTSALIVSYVSDEADRVAAVQGKPMERGKVAFEKGSSVRSARGAREVSPLPPKESRSLSRPRTHARGRCRAAATAGARGVRQCAQRRGAAW
jgi:hypothetical protein